MLTELTRSLRENPEVRRAVDGRVGCTLMKITVVEHPAAAMHLARLRSTDTGRDEFRQHLDALATVLVVEALADVAAIPTRVETPLGTADGMRIEPMPTLVPVLRAGLGMLDAALRLVPEAPVGFLGTQRIESSGTLSVDHRHYLETLPADVGDRPAIVLDPMLATGGTLIDACITLSDAGARPLTVVCALAAPEGVAALQAAGAGRFEAHVVTAAIDSHLDERAYIVPGLGDAGDRLYGTS